jgi:predicted ATPase
VALIGSVIGRDFSYALLRAVTGIGEAPLQAALEQLAEADLLLVQGLPPDSEYRFKHALIQDAAYENLLRSRRQVLHGPVAETLRDNLAGTASAEPELLAHHFTQAGLTVAAIEWWGKAGQRSVERSAFEAAEQFTHALAQIAGLPATPALRREEINLQVAPEDSLLLFAAFFGLMGASTVAFNGDVLRKLTVEVLALAEKQRAAAVHQSARLPPHSFRRKE